jgi:hypothetical protein
MGRSTQHEKLRRIQRKWHASKLVQIGEPQPTRAEQRDEIARMTEGVRVKRLPSGKDRTVRYRL